MLRTSLDVAGARLAADLERPPDFAQFAKVGDTAASELDAMVSDVGRTRAHVGSYLLHAADYFDDERLDQLGDGYVRAAQLWFEVAAQPDADIGPSLLSLERECAVWMQRAAEPPTRYAF